MCQAPRARSPEQLSKLTSESEAIKVAVVDHGTGNLTSLVRALEHLGCDPVRLTQPSDQSDFDCAFLPGVGAFPSVMRALRGNGWVDWINDWVASARPLLGVCLGMQLLFEESDELGGAEGLGLIPGRVTGLESKGERLPHIGWSPIEWKQKSTLSMELESEAAMYHVHSFACRPLESSAVLATAVHGEEFVTAAWNGENVYGVQFHPEKSSGDGLQLISNFLNIGKEQRT